MHHIAALPQFGATKQAMHAESPHGSLAGDSHVLIQPLPCMLTFLMDCTAGDSHVLVQPEQLGGRGRVHAGGSGAGPGHLQCCAAGLPAATGPLPQAHWAVLHPQGPAGHGAHPGQVPHGPPSV